MSIGSVPSLIVGVGAGAAASAAFEPALERPKQDAWAAAPNRLPDVGLIAALVAGGKVSQADGRSMAKRLGFDTGPFDSITWLAQDRLDFAVMLRLWRLFPDYVTPSGKTITQLVDETLAHEQLDWNYHDLLLKLQTAEKPGIGDIAYAVVRGYLPTDIALPVPPPSTSTKVKRFPQSTKKAEEWAQEIGYDSEALELFIARSGLSLAPGLAAQAYFRQLIADDDYHLAIAEGDLRTEWADVLRDATRQIPTADQFIEGWLRGWITQTEAEAGAAKHGMSTADTDLIYKTKGRPVTFHEITTGLARGGTYPSTYDDIPEPYRKSIQEADIRPEWADLHYANRYLYPSAFVLRSLAQAGELGGQQAVEQILLEIGWKPSFATTVSTAWTAASPTGAKADPHVTKAESQVWTATHKAYVDSLISDATATASLGAAGVAAAAIPTVLGAWRIERDIVRKSLSAAQIKKAWTEQIPDPALGRPWTEAEAVTRLQDLGYTADDAKILLVE